LNEVSSPLACILNIHGPDGQPLSLDTTAGSGSLGGKTSARNLTAAERSARAKKASLVAAKVRTKKRLEAEAAKRAKK
jgi:hypothetical protein